ncbi:ABC transporter permease [Amycolatopsis anabasis]|uniref:ABC transporter permease n=1 Tax=Amycolatopsis anabasis TaxID=1840409 RepID=UPI00131E0B84|nr:ABC transporter permease [Amycolatopsis anabasis]
MTPNSTSAAIRAGLVRGRIEFRQAMTNADDLLGLALPTAIFLVVMIFLRDAKVPGTELSIGTMSMAGVLGAGVVFNGLFGIAQILTIEREDGTLLRAKAVPDGMLGYLIGKIVSISGQTLVGLILTLVPSLFLFDGMETGPGTWLTLAWVLALGLIASLPLGAIIGSLFSNPRNMGVIMMPIMGITATSGIFYPLSHFPEWLQWVGQVFPIYWMGLGMRSALLPDSLAAVEIGESWRHLETLGVLGLWAAAGLIIAPIVLRRMARRESGSSVAARREKAMQRIG